MRNELIDIDGFSVMPVPKRYERNILGFGRYLTDIRKELRQNDMYNDSSIPVLLHTLEAALKQGVLSDLACRGFMESGVQMLWFYRSIYCQRMFLGKMKFERYGDHKEPIFDTVEEQWFDWPVQSRILDFLMFTIETILPHANLLECPRVMLEVIPWVTQANKIKALALEPDNISNRWRRQINECACIAKDSDYLKNNDKCKTGINCFKLGEKEMLSKFKELGHWVYMAGIRDFPQGILISFDDTKFYKVYQIFDQPYLDLCIDFCDKYRLELVGCFKNLTWRTRSLHYIPRKVHVTRTRSVVHLSIPDFYTAEMIRTNLDKTLFWLTAAFQNGKPVRNLTGAFEQETLRKLSVEIRRVVKESSSKDYAETFIAVIWNALGLNSASITTSKKSVVVTSRKTPSLYDCVLCVSRLMQEKCTSDELHLTWRAVIHLLTAKGRI